MYPAGQAEENQAADQASPGGYNLAGLQPPTNLRCARNGVSDFEFYHDTHGSRQPHLGICAESATRSHGYSRAMPAPKRHHAARSPEAVPQGRDPPGGGQLLGREISVGCHQIVQPEQSHECPPSCAVREPVRAHCPWDFSWWLPNLATASPRVERRPLEVQAHRAAVHRGGWGDPWGHLRAAVRKHGILYEPGRARGYKLDALPSIEGGRRRGHRPQWEIPTRRTGGWRNTALIMEEADLSTAASREISRHG